MKCPIDSVDLLMSDRQGIEIDYCPTCRGVWLDRGELDKIIERNTGDGALAGETARAGSYDRSDNGHRTDGSSPKTKKRKREGYLGELFEFGG